jgi:hypothetical protein
MSCIIQYTTTIRIIRTNCTTNRVKKAIIPIRSYTNSAKKEDVFDEPRRYNGNNNPKSYSKFKGIKIKAPTKTGKAQKKKLASLTLKPKPKAIKPK